MPQLNRHGDWCAGVAGTPASWGTASGTGTLIPDALAADWFTDDLVVVQDCSGASCVLKTHNVRLTGIKQVAPRGANTLAAGGGVWAAWLADFGLFTSSGLTLPDASLGTVGPDGAIAVKRRYQSTGPWDVHEKDGLVWLLTAGDAVYPQLLGGYRGVWTEGGTPRTAGACPVPNPMTRPYAWLTMSPPPTPTDPDGWWVLYQDASGRLLLHPATSTSGYVLAPAASLTYRPQLVRRSPTTIRVVWSTTEGEAPAAIVVTTVDLTAARTILGSATPPTWTEPTGPPTRPAAIGHDDVASEGHGLYPPYQQPIVDRPTGRVTTPWHRFFLTLASGDAVDTLAAAPPPAGSLPLNTLQSIDSPRLLGRGTAGVGPVEQLTIGAGLALVDLELSVTADISTLGYWTPITNGDALSPEILFDAEGDCVVGFVPTSAGIGGSGSGGGSGGALPAHAITHETGGSDALPVTALAGFSGLGTEFLTGLGTWAEPAGGAHGGTLGIVIDGGGAPIVPGVKGYFEVGVACTITAATLLVTDAATTAGSMVVEVWKAPYASYPPTVADRITASTPPTLSSAIQSRDTTLTGWTTTIAPGDILAFVVVSATTVTKVALTLTVQV